MLKNDYGKLNTPYFYQGFDNKVDLYLMPKNIDTSSISIYISKGEFNSEPSLKLPNYCSYLLNKLISKQFIKETSDKNYQFESYCDYSYNLFTITSKEDVFPLASNLMDRISQPFYDEKDCDLIKKEAGDSLILESNLDKLYREVIKNLYINSPIKNYYLPTIDKLNYLHASSLKKYQDRYFTSDRITFFITSKITIDEAIKKVVDFKYSTLENNSKSEYYSEDYSKVNTSSTSVDLISNKNYLTMGIKFPKRESIYEVFLDQTFQIYEVLTDTLFRYNPNFNTLLYENNFVLEDTRIIEASEDACLLLTISGKEQEKMITFLNSYMNNLSKKVNDVLFYKARNNYYIDQFKNLNSIYTINQTFAKSVPNRVIAPALITRTMKLKYEILKKFIDDLKTFKRSFVFGKQNG